MGKGSIPRNNAVLAACQLFRVICHYRPEAIIRKWPINRGKRFLGFKMSRNVMLIMCVIFHVDGSLWLARVHHVPPDKKLSCTSKRTKKMWEGDKRWQKDKKIDV
jgi:hypothetical protein